GQDDDVGVLAKEREVGREWRGQRRRGRRRGAAARRGNADGCDKRSTRVTPSHKPVILTKVQSVERRQVGYSQLSRRCVMEARETGSPLLPKSADDFRDYEHARPGVEEFYRLNHTNQTLAFVLAKKRDYLTRSRK